MYVVLEGIDGAGKTTHTELLKKYFINKNVITNQIVEPTDSDIGKLIRKELKNNNSTNDTNQQKLALLFAADRLTLKYDIEKYENNKDNLLLSDRSFYSSICYQNNESIPKEWVSTINKYAKKPDLLIILDLDEKEAIKRCSQEEVFETLDFLKKTRQNYLKLLESENAVKVNVSKSIEEVQKELIDIISKLLE